MVRKKALLAQVVKLERDLAIERRINRSQDRVIEGLMHDITDVRRKCGLMGDNR